MERFETDEPGRALIFLGKLKRHGGIVVLSSNCSEEEVSQARLEKRVFVDHAGICYVLKS